MKLTQVCAVLSTLTLATGVAIRRAEPEDDACSVVWVTVTATASADTISSSSAAATTSSTQSVPDTNTAIQDSSSVTATTSLSVTQSTGATSASSSASSSASAGSSSAPSTTSSGSPQPSTGSGGDSSSSLDLSDVHLPGGQAPIPINDNYVHAPEDNTPIPADVVVFTPAEPGVFDNTAFAQWRDHYRDNPPPSKFLKVKPGAYRYKLGPKLNPGDDPNNTVGENLIMYLMAGGWTLDLRGVTFYIDFTPENILQRPSVAIYTLQSESLTVIGGTIWTDWGEIYTQARVTAINGDTATFEVEQGYNVSKWREAGPRNQACVDPSDANHYKFGDCNFWKVDTYNFANLDSDRTFTAHLLGGDGLAVGYVVTMMNGQNQANTVFTLANEANTKLHVKGMTTNGGFMSIGLDNGEVAPVFENCYSVNPPPRPGFARRVLGPLMAWGNINLGAYYNEPNRPEAQFINSYYQWTGNNKDLWDTSNPNSPS